jgi:PilZ domain
MSRTAGAKPDQDQGMQPAPSGERASRAKVRMRAASSRARRLPLDLPVRYRPVGANRWHEGRVENISRSGILFRTVDLLDVDTRVEMTLVLPARLSAAAIVCRGRVVRTVLPGGLERRPGLVATISRYRFRGRSRG